MINKTKNINLQITINKNDYDLLMSINDGLNQSLGMELTKSQTIAYLIKQYRYNGLNQSQEHRVEESKAKREEDIIKFRTMTNALKDKLDVSYPRLSEMLGIHQSTLKKYCSGKQAPTGENREILLSAFKKYGIK